jgi:hypothetical protein
MGWITRIGIVLLLLLVILLPYDSRFTTASGFYCLFPLIAAIIMSMLFRKRRQ